MKNEKQLIVIPCALLRDFSNAPKDQIDCILTDCPTCEKRMWLSAAKRRMLASYKIEDIFLGCYDCVLDFANNNKNLFDQAARSLVNVDYNYDKKKYDVQCDSKYGSEIDNILNKK